jgi:DNA-binding response OmpR family regulator
MSDKVLIVDDEPNVLRMLGYALEVAGYAITTAQTGMEALGKVEIEQPDLVILDIMMPDMSGIEVCQQLRANPGTAHLPVIILSARGQVVDKIGGFKAGADEYVTKPVDPDEMIVRVAALLERTRRLRQARPVKRAKLLGFLGAKGGVGTTTVALNVASVLAAQNNTVIAVELRSCHGTFAVQLGHVPRTNLSNLLELDLGTIDSRALSRVLINVLPGLSVLFGPQEVNQFREIDPDHAEAIITGLAGMADYVIIDFPCYPSTASQAAMRSCDFVTLVVDPEPMCVMCGEVALKLLKSWGVSSGIVGIVVVNRTELAMELRGIWSRLGCEIVGVVPPARQACIAAQQQGLPLVRYQPQSMAAMGLAEIGNRLMGDKVMAMSL